jgi:glucoamylase
MDEAALPILLMDIVGRHSRVPLGNLRRRWASVERAAGFIVRNGPVTQQDRWEEDAGYSPFTLAVEIAGLLAAADLADAVEEQATASHLRETADCWNDNIERWIYAKDSDLARQVGVEGYYVRIAPPEADCAPSPLEGFVPIKNRPPGQSAEAAVHLISPDALARCDSGCARRAIPEL